MRWSKSASRGDTRKPRSKEGRPDVKSGASNFASFYTILEWGEAHGVFGPCARRLGVGRVGLGVSARRRRCRRCRPPGWVAGGRPTPRVGVWAVGWVGGWVRGGCQSIELVKLRRFAVLKGEHTPILENSCPGGHWRPAHLLLCYLLLGDPPGPRRPTPSLPRSPSPLPHSYRQCAGLFGKI